MEVLLSIGVEGALWETTEQLLSVVVHCGCQTVHECDEVRECGRV